MLYNRSFHNSQELTLIPIPDGDFDAHVPSLQLQMTLQRYQRNMLKRFFAHLLTLYRFGFAVSPPVPLAVDVQTLPLEISFLKTYSPYLPPSMEVSY